MSRSQPAVNVKSRKRPQCHLLDTYNADMWAECDLKLAVAGVSPKLSWVYWKKRSELSKVQFKNNRRAIGKLDLENSDIEKWGPVQEVMGQTERLKSAVP